MKQSVAGICLKDSQFLIALRLPGGSMGSRWEFPGGKVEPGESCEQALAREFMEEFGFTVSVGDFIAEAVFEHGNIPRLLRAYQVFLPSGNIDWHFTEHTQILWVPLEEVEKRVFVDSDLLLLPGIRGWLEK